MTYWTHNLSPFLFQWGPDSGIRYYGLAYMLGFVAVLVGLKIFRDKGWSSLNFDQSSSLLTHLILGVIIGGRLVYCFLYDFEYTLQDPVSIIRFWDGGISGMASHGGFIGVILAALIFAKRNKIPAWNLYDNLSTLAPIGFFLGRIANFINGELWGRVSYVSWAVIFPKAPLVNGVMAPRHPSQLYEALGEGLLLFLFMLWIRTQKFKTGTPAILFLIFYATARIICEFYREADAQIGYYFGWLSQGQLLSVILILIALVLWKLKNKYV